MLLNGALAPGKCQDIPSAAQLQVPLPGWLKEVLHASSSPLNFQFFCISVFSFACRGWIIYFYIVPSEFLPLYTLSSVHLAPLSQISSVQSLFTERGKDFLSMAGMLQFLNCPKTTFHSLKRIYRAYWACWMCEISWMKLILWLWKMKMMQRKREEF